MGIGSTDGTSAHMKYSHTFSGGVSDLGASSTGDGRETDRNSAIGAVKSDVVGGGHIWRGSGTPASNPSGSWSGRGVWGR